MTNRSTIFGIISIGALAITMYGCGGSSTSQPSSPDTHEDAAQEGTDMNKMKESLAKLSEADRASAEKQHFCPVSGEMLGTMGVPQKVEVNGRDVWICCSGCKDKLLAEPDKYLSKLQK